MSYILNNAVVVGVLTPITNANQLPQVAPHPGFQIKIGGSNITDPVTSATLLANTLYQFYNGAYITYDSAAGGGDVVGPASSTAHALTSYANTSGLLLESISTITVGANNTLTGTGSTDFVITSANNTDLVLQAAGTGVIVVSDAITTADAALPSTLLLSSGSSNSGNNPAGDIGLFTGNGNGSGAGGEIALGTGSSTSGAGGDISLTTANGGPSGGRGGNLTILLGNSLSGVNPGGAFTLTTGNATGASTGGDFVLTTGIGGISGGNVNITTGNGGTGSPGSMSITTGNATSNDNAGGDVSIQLGNGNGAAGGGNFYVIGGASGATADAGIVYIQASEGGATSGKGGDIQLVAGNAAGGTSAGGNIVLTAGTGIGGGVDGQIQLTGQLVNTTQSAFLAYLSSNVTSATGNGASYTLGTTALTEVFDQGNNFNTNGTFTAPVTGRYQLNACASFGNCTVATTFAIQIVTSNRTYSRQEVRAAGSGNWSMNYSTLADMDAADTATVVVTVLGEAGNSVSVLGTSNLITCFSGYLVC